MSLYAQSKALLDHEVARLLATNPKYKIQGWRYFNVYGPCEGHKGEQASPITKFTNQALDDNNIKIFKNSDNFKRDFICVDDIIRIKYETSSKSVSGIYNLGTGNPVSFKYVAQEIAKKFNASLEEIEFPENLKGQYQEYTCADLTKLRTVIGDYRFISVDDFVNSL
jgi:ADP-L-glycero-D-manno-heptose 6-epimerase